MFEFAPGDDQKNLLCKQIQGKVKELSLHMYGCRVIQKALEVITFDKQMAIMDELRENVTACVQNQNGNHVIQKCIERVPSEHVNFIIDSFKGRAYDMSVHAYGCRVIQRMLEHCKDE